MVFGVSEPIAIAGPCTNQPNGSYVNSPTNCRAYYACSNGLAIAYLCPYGFYFNEAKQLCDLPENVLCETLNGDVTTETPPNTDATPGPAPTAGTDVPGTTDETDIFDLICDGHPDGYLINNPISCQAFWRCTNGMAIPGQCESAFNFNEPKQLCDHPANYPCDNRPLCPPQGIHTYKKHNSCTEFYFCFAGFLTIRQCAPGLHFDSAKGQCNFPVLAECEESVCPLINDPDNIVTLPSKERCDE